MRNDNRGVLAVLFVVLILIVGIGVWMGTRQSPSSVQSPQPVGTTGPVSVEKARERGAQVGEQLAVATNKVAETAKESAITAKVKTKMALDDLVKARAIDVTTNGTTVTLEGHVGSRAEHDRVIALARETSGVTNIVDRLTIQS
jgi:osmotically-inducible protein OsmY